MSQENEKKSLSVMAIVGFVIGIIALLTSWMPILNNGSFFVALIGLVFAVVGIVGTFKGKRKGKGFAIAAAILNVLAVAIVLGSQSLYVDALNGPKATETSAQSSLSESTQSEDEDPDYSNLAVGSSIKLENGLVVSVDKVEFGLSNYDNSAVCRVAVTYKNTGSSTVDYNVYDWKAEDKNGAQEDYTYYSEAKKELGSGSLASGGKKSGNLYFDGKPAKVIYYASVFNDEGTATWNLKKKK